MQKKLNPDDNSGRLTGKWCLTRRFWGGYDIKVECKSLHLGNMYWRKATQEELAYLGINTIT